jgi:hypothetical protein
MVVDFTIGKFNLRSDFEYKRVEDFRRKSNTNVTMMYLSLERAFSTRF